MKYFREFKKITGFDPENYDPEQECRDSIIDGKYISTVMLKEYINFIDNKYNDLLNKISEGKNK